MKLSIILATRKRPHLLIKTVRTTLKNITNKETELSVMIDADDEETILCQPQLEKLGATVWVLPRPSSLGEKYNSGVLLVPADVYLVMVDYAPHITPGFDDKILDAASIYPDGIAIVRNWYANLSFPGINAVTWRYVQLAGGIYPKIYPFWFVDHHLDDVAQMLGRYVTAEIEIDTSERKDAPGKPWTQGRRDTWLWAWIFDAAAGERRALAEKIINSKEFEETPARKRALLGNIPAVLQHSMLVNQHARQDIGIEPTEDDWYDRVRAIGVARLKSLLSSKEDLAHFLETERALAEHRNPKQQDAA